MNAKGFLSSCSNRCGSNLNGSGNIFGSRPINRGGIFKMTSLGKVKPPIVNSSLTDLPIMGTLKINKFNFNIQCLFITHRWIQSQSFFNKFFHVSQLI